VLRDQVFQLRLRTGDIVFRDETLCQEEPRSFQVGSVACFGNGPQLLDA